MTNQQIEVQIDAAIAPQADDKIELRARKVLFDDGRITLYFNNDATSSFLTDSVETISILSSKILATVELNPSGRLRWDEADIDLSIQSLLLGIFGSNIWMKQIATKGSSSTSQKKKAASKANGQKGGRPKKKANK